jgi:hypothetical protein
MIVSNNMVADIDDENDAPKQEDEEEFKDLAFQL